MLSKISIFPPRLLRKWVIPVTGSVHKCFAKFVAILSIFAFDTFFGFFSSNMQHEASMMVEALAALLITVIKCQL